MGDVAPPNTWVLVSGTGIHFSYTTATVDGRPQATYQDATHIKQFAGDQIRAEQTVDLGTTVSVTTALGVDSLSSTFTVLLPRTSIVDYKPVAIATIGVVSIHHGPIVEPPRGQMESFTPAPMTGVASIHES